MQNKSSGKIHPYSVKSNSTSKYNFNLLMFSSMFIRSSIFYLQYCNYTHSKLSNRRFTVGLKWSPGVNSWKVMDRSQSWYEKHSDLPEGSKLNVTMFPPENVEDMHLERW